MPCGIAAGTPQSFPQPPWQLMPTTSGVPHPNQQVGCAPLPAQIHQISSWRRIRGCHTPVPRVLFSDPLARPEPSGITASRRTHDLRHGAASLAREASADLKTLQDLLGRSSIVVTADTYTSVLPEVQRHCADATAHLVLAAARRTRKKSKNKARKNRPARRPKTGAPIPATPGVASQMQVRTVKGEKNPPSGLALTSHPCDTHHPHSRKGLTAITASQTLHDLARPKGFEPLTF